MCRINIVISYQSLLPTKGCWTENERMCQLSYTRYRENVTSCWNPYHIACQVKWPNGQRHMIWISLLFCSLAHLSQRIKWDFRIQTLNIFYFFFRNTQFESMYFYFFAGKGCDFISRSLALINILGWREFKLLQMNSLALLE